MARAAAPSPRPSSQAAVPWGTVPRSPSCSLASERAFPGPAARTWEPRTEAHLVDSSPQAQPVTGALGSGQAPSSGSLSGRVPSREARGPAPGWPCLRSPCGPASFWRLSPWDPKEACLCRLLGSPSSQHGRLLHQELCCGGWGPGSLLDHGHHVGHTAPWNGHTCGSKLDCPSEPPGETQIAVVGASHAWGAQLSGKQLESDVLEKVLGATARATWQQVQQAVDGQAFSQPTATCPAPLLRVQGRKTQRDKAQIRASGSVDHPVSSVC